jgi:hypothetical protein
VVLDLILVQKKKKKIRETTDDIYIRFVVKHYHFVIDHCTMAMQNAETGEAGIHYSIFATFSLKSKIISRWKVNKHNC